MLAYTFEKCYDWLYRIVDPLSVLCYVLVGEEEALLFDTGHGLPGLRETVREITDKPITVVLGHGHIDHANGSNLFGKAFIHPGDVALCKEHTSPGFRQDVLKQVAENGIQLPQGFDADAYIHGGAGTLEMLSDGQVFDLGGLHVQVVEMIGHTKGSIGIWVKEKRSLLVSDSANCHVWMFLNESTSLREYAAMLTRVYELPFDTFFVAHQAEELPKSDMLKFSAAALNATIEKAKPYGVLTELEPYIYEENGAAVVFNRRTLDNG